MMEGLVEGQKSAPFLTDESNRRPCDDDEPYPQIYPDDDGNWMLIKFPGAPPERFHEFENPPGVINRDTYCPPQTRVPKTPLPQPPCASVNYSELSVEEGVKLQNVHTAEAALAYYNKKHHTDYKLVDALGSNGFLASNIWFHTSFTAKPSTPHNGDSSAKLFFAEMHSVRPLCPVVNCCRIVEGAKTKIGCVFCKSLVHPTHGFRKGLHQPKYRSLRSNSKVFH